MHANTRSSATASPASKLYQQFRKRADSSTAALWCDSCDVPVQKDASGELVCPECHIVQVDQPISRAPCPNYGDENRKRTGSSLTHRWADRGLGTGIDSNSTTDAHGNSLSATQRRLTRETGWTKHRTPEECRLDYALGEIRRMAADYEISDPILEDASKLYRRARAEGLVEGRSVEGFATACLIAGIRRSPERIPVSERELEPITRADTGQIRVARSLLTQKLGIEIPPIDPEAFFPRAVTELSIDYRVERRARRILDTYLNGEGAHRGTSPRTLAAASVHAAYDLADWDERPTLESLSNVFDVARSTISTRKGLLLEAVENDA